MVAASRIAQADRRDPAQDRLMKGELGQEWTWKLIAGGSLEPISGGRK